VAKLQREVGRRLLAHLHVVPTASATVLDLGCGTGFFQPDLSARYPAATYIGLDLAPGMIEYARTRSSCQGLWIVGDAESLPLATESVDVVFSSLAVQWCSRPDWFLAELARVLKPGGRCVFTTLGPDTLHELRQSWAAVDAYQHVNNFLPAEALIAAAGRVSAIELILSTERHCMQYQRVGELLTELKSLGAHNMNRRRPAGLTSRKTLQGMLQAYESWRADGLLPATYDVIFGEVKKV
jgi:malonyl-CoA O-methyltransferase